MIYPYRLIRSARKTLALEVSSSGEVIARAPNRTSLKTIEAFVASHEQWIEKALARQAARAACHPPLSPEQIEALREEAKRKIPPRVAYFAERMNVTPKSVRITAAKTRFGSCSPENSLCFSLYLMQYPDEAIDYVVVHELSHIRHHDHSKRFWDTVALYMPEYKRLRALLKQ